MRALPRASGRSPKEAIRALNSRVQDALVSLSADLEGRLTEELPGADRK